MHINTTLKSQIYFGHLIFFFIKSHVVENNKLDALYFNTVNFK
jgi:hypothetical protein